MLRRLILAATLAVLVAGDHAPVLAQGLFGFGNDQPQQQQQGGQQQPKRRTLFDMLFGGGDQPTPPPAPVVVKPKKAALPPPPKPQTQKAANATRLAVFGDTMAVDLAAALDRFYTDDPNIVVINQGVSNSGLARPDYFDWDKTAVDQVSKNSFDIAVMIVGTNDRQTIRQDGASLKALTPDWDDVYKSRVAAFVSAVHGANKPLIWVGLPPMAGNDLNTALSDITSIQRLAVFAGGADFLDIYDKFVDDNGDYSATGPDINGNIVKLRKDDGVRLTAAGADKLAFYLSQQLKLYYHGGGDTGLVVADALAGTDAAIMVRPPYQGLGQTRLLEVAGAVIPLSQTPKRASELVTANTAAPPAPAGFDMTQMLDAPQGRVDAFGVGKPPTEETAAKPAAAAAPASSPPPASVAAKN
jgi:hypothetical protein